MFHIFTKKRFLVDALSGFVDIHNHILPGIDDGAKTVEDSIAMIRGFESIGITKFIATPHIMADYYPNTPETIECALNLLNSELLKLGIKHISIAAAAEYMIDSNFENLLQNRWVLPLREKFLLIEMSYLQPPINFDAAIALIKKNGYYPVLAHPERYAFLHQDERLYDNLKSQGLLFQMNLLSMTDYYGRKVNKIASKLLQNNLVDFVGTDAHRLDQLMILKEINLTRKALNNLNPIISNTIEHFF